MNLQQWQIWKSRPPGFARDHWFVILSGQERLDNPQRLQVNGLACYKLQGDAKKLDVRLNGADGFDGPTVCQCDFIFVLDKRDLQSCLGSVTWERQQAIKSKLKEVHRL
jgi:hypothetical protein